jgi:hypothetical protein
MEATMVNTIRMADWEYETALAWDGMAWERNADVSARVLVGRPVARRDLAPVGLASLSPAERARAGL